MSNINCAQVRHRTRIGGARGPEVPCWRMSETVEQGDALRREAQRSEALLDALYSGAPIGLGFLDRELRFVRVNEELARINDRSPEDHIGRTIAEVVPLLSEL